MELNGASLLLGGLGEVFITETVVSCRLDDKELRGHPLTLAKAEVLDCGDCHPL